MEEDFEIRNIEAILQNARTLISSKNQKARLKLVKKYRDDPEKLWKRDL